MQAEKFVEILDANFFTGVPDSTLNPLCDYLIDRYGISKRHIIAANEGNAVALAAGHYLSTGKIPVVYIQNSGIGNMINPAASLLNERVCQIPVMFVVGWRGEPGIPEPGVARACGYPKALSVRSEGDLKHFLETVKERTLIFCEIQVAAVSRKDLGRTKTGAVQMREEFQRMLGGSF